MKATWSEGERVREADVCDLSAALGLVRAAEENACEPTVIEFWDEKTGAAISVLVAFPGATVITFQDTLDPPYFISSGTALPGSGVVAVRHNGEIIEYLRKNFVPPGVITSTLRGFWTNRNKPHGIEWEQL